MSCKYCIQKGMVLPNVPRRPWRKYEELPGRAWVKALNDLPVRPEHALILTGGEPTLHKDFVEIAKGLDEGYKLDLTSNLAFNIPELAREMEKAGKRFYSSFHTYNPDFMEPGEFVERAELVLKTGLVENPVFSFLNLELFPQFRNDETNNRIKKMLDLAGEKGIKICCNEFRANHMGSPFSREGRKTMECTSAWVNIAPDGWIYNCQYHLTEGRNSFGNITDPGTIRFMPRLGTFFKCDDFGWCDPCHENSGAGMFRDPVTKVVFRRDPDASFMNYTKWLTPEELTDAGRRFVKEGKPGPGAAFLAKAWGKTGDPVTLNDLGVAFWNAGKREEALDCFAASLKGGNRDPACVKNLLELAGELGLEGRARELLKGMGLEECAEKRY